MRLPAKRQAFARKYVKNKGNGSKSYKEAGYKASTDLTARVEASRLLTIPNVKAEIKRLMAKEVKTDILTANEVLGGLSAKARADIADVLEADGTFNLAKAKERGKSKLIKSLKFDKDTGKVIGVELYSAHEAERDLGKFHKLFSERVETVDLTAIEGHRSYIANELQRLRLKHSDDDEYEAAVTQLRAQFVDADDPAYDPLLDWTKHPENWPDLPEQPTELDTTA